MDAAFWLRFASYKKTLKSTYYVRKKTHGQNF
jgi:hypothetical protein